MYRKTLFFRRILISRFPYVENSLHFNVADVPVNFIKQFASGFFWCLKQILLSKFVPYYCLHYIIPRILHIISRKSWYSMQTQSWWWAIPKICVYFRDVTQIAKIWCSRNILVLQYLACKSPAGIAPLMKCLTSMLVRHFPQNWHEVSFSDHALCIGDLCRYRCFSHQQQQKLKLCRLN